jgi:hypothetical protein
MELVRATPVVFRFAEIGQNFVETPSGIPELPPNVEVLRLSANINQPVDRTGSAKNPSARRDDFAVVTSRLRLGLITPIVSAIVEQLAEAERNVKPGMPVMWARLQENDAMPAGCCKPIGQNASRTAGPHNNVVKCL